ncbi:hypothetical protein PFISCL1PPCAC_19119, partial [Pristionchus fissidentatus]
AADDLSTTTLGLLVRPLDSQCRPPSFFAWLSQVLGQQWRVFCKRVALSSSVVSHPPIKCLMISSRPQLVS